MIRFIFKLIRFIVRIITILASVVLGVAFALSLLFPLGYKADIVKYSNEQGIDPFLVASVIKTESNYFIDAKSHKDAIGLMQITPSTGEWIASKNGKNEFNSNDLYRSDVNIEYGTWYIRKLYDIYGSEELVLAAYNAGMGNVNDWLNNDLYTDDGVSLKSIPFKETEDYLQRVDSNYKIYKKLYAKLIYSDEVFIDYYFKGIIKIRDIAKMLKMKI